MDDVFYNAKTTEELIFVVSPWLMRALGWRCVLLIAIHCRLNPRTRISSAKQACLPCSTCFTAWPKCVLLGLTTETFVATIAVPPIAKWYVARLSAVVCSGIADLRRTSFLCCSTGDTTPHCWRRMRTFFTRFAMSVTRMVATRRRMMSVAGPAMQAPRFELACTCPEAERQAGRLG